MNENAMINTRADAIIRLFVVLLLSFRCNTDTLIAIDFRNIAQFQITTKCFREQVANWYILPLIIHFYLIVAGFFLPHRS